MAAYLIFYSGFPCLTPGNVDGIQCGDTGILQIKASGPYKIQICGKRYIWDAKKPPEKFPEGFVNWCARQDLNLRPTDS